MEVPARRVRRATLHSMPGLGYVNKNYSMSANHKPIQAKIVLTILFMILARCRRRI